MKTKIINFTTDNRYSYILMASDLLIVMDESGKACSTDISDIDAFACEHPKIFPNASSVNITKKIHSGADSFFLYDLEETMKSDAEEDIFMVNDVARLAWIYCYTNKNNPKLAANTAMMRNFLLRTKSPYYAIEYCHLVEDDADMRQVVLDDKDSIWASRYSRILKSDRDDMHQKVACGSNPRAAYLYCQYVAISDALRQVVINGGCKESIEDYCKYIAKDADMVAALS